MKPLKRFFCDLLLDILRKSVALTYETIDK